MKQYQDVTMTGQVDQYLFGIGQHFEVYERFGAHLTEKDGMEGVCFFCLGAGGEVCQRGGDF